MMMPEMRRDDASVMPDTRYADDARASLPAMRDATRWRARATAALTMTRDVERDVKSDTRYVSARRAIRHYADERREMIVVRGAPIRGQPMPG